MSYYAGIAPSAATVMRTQPREPHVKCDNCGTTKVIWFPAPAWFLDNEAVPGWTKQGEDAQRKDYCGQCAALYKATRTEPAQEPAKP